MLEPAFEALGPMLESEDPASSLDYLIGQFRESQEYHLMFEATLMKKRLELGLPLIQAPNLGTLPPDVQTKYQQFLVEAAQETGELFLASGNIPKAWPYLRATGDVKRVAAAIEKVEPGENLDGIIRSHSCRESIRQRVSISPSKNSAFAERSLTSAAAAERKTASNVSPYWRAAFIPN